MGQIVFNGQKPKYCNLQSIQTGGQHVTDDVALGEVWLVDTTNSNKGDSGTGKYDAYIIGDGIKKAGQLTLNYIDTPIDMSRYSTTIEMQLAIQNAINSADIPRNLSDLSEDSTHRTVTDAEKAVWNSSGGGGGGNPVDNEDLTLALQDSTSVIKFKDRAYSPANYSSLGRKYLRKNIQTTSEQSITTIAKHNDSSLEYEFTKGGFIGLSTVNTGDVVSLTPSTEISDWAAVDPAHREDTTPRYSYAIIDVNEGDKFLLQAQIVNSDYVRAWAFIDSNNNLISKSNNKKIKILFGTQILTAPANGKLIVNTDSAGDINYWISKITVEENEINILTQEMFDSPYTAYIIQYDYTLNYNSITLPEGAVLIFDGGSISNGAIIGNHSKFIEQYNRQIFNLDVYLYGTWDTEDFYPEYYGAVGDGVMDCYQHIQKCLDTIYYISTGQLKNCILPKTYKITHGLLVYGNTRIIGGSNSAWTKVTYNIVADFENKQQWIIDSATISWKNWETYPPGEVCPYNAFANAAAADRYVFQDNHNIIIRNLSVGGKVVTDSSNIRHYIFGGIRIQRSNHSHLSDVYVDGVWIGIAHASQWYSSDSDLWISARNIALYFAADANHFTVYNGYINSPDTFNNIDINEYPVVNGQLDRPTNIVCHYSSGSIINPITQGGGYAYNISGGDGSSRQDNDGCNIYISHPYIEGSYYIFYCIREYCKCVVNDGTYVATPKVAFCKTYGSTSDGSGATLRLIGNNDIYKFASSLGSGSSAISYDNTILDTGIKEPEKYSNYGHHGALAYSVWRNKYYMIGKYGATGLDGYNYQTKFIGSSLPSEDNLKLGTPFILQQSDRFKPVFQKIAGVPLKIAVHIITVPETAPAGTNPKIRFNILGTAYNVGYGYFAGITRRDIAKQIYRSLRASVKCYEGRDFTSDIVLYIEIPYEEYINSADKTCSYEDVTNTGLVCTLTTNSPVQAQYVDYLGNNGNFEYKFYDLPLTAVEGTIGYWALFQKPVYFKNGGWYDFMTNTLQEVTFEFSDHTTEQQTNISKTGGTASYIVRSTVNNSSAGITILTAYDNIVANSIVDNLDGTYTINISVSPNVYTSDISAPVYIYQKDTGKLITITLNIEAADEAVNIVFDNADVKSNFLYYDKNNDGELSYDEALTVTSCVKRFSNIVGTSENKVTIDFRIFPNLLEFNCNNKFPSNNYVNIILPITITSINKSTSYNPFSYLGTNSNVLVCLSKIPPRIVNCSLSKFSKIYVPDISVNLYKDYTETTGGKYPAAKIFPISEIDDNALRAKLGLEPLTENESESEGE